MDLSDIVANIGRAKSGDSKTPVDPITFIEAPWGLGLKLFPVQRVILKTHYGMELDDNPNDYPLDVPVPKTHPNYSPYDVDRNGFYAKRIVITDFKRENPQYLSEAGYLRFLHAEGRSNTKEVVPGKQRREMILSVGRRSGKTLITSCIVAYETYKLLLLGNPQKHYGSSQSNVIQLISVATDQAQASLLYREASGHFQKCDYFRPYTANATQSYATFQTPFDIDTYGSYKDNPKARYSINVTFKSCVAKGLRGGANIMVALDEVAHFGEQGQASADEVYQAVEPSTRTFSPKDPEDTTIPISENEGRIVMISSPLGKQGLFYKQFMLGFGDNKAADNLLCIQAPTWEVNPTVPAETFVASYLKDPNVFYTEFGAVFTDRTRGWIQNAEDLTNCIDNNLKPVKKGIFRTPYFMGIDIALVGDWCAVAIGHNDHEGKVVVDLMARIKAGHPPFQNEERLDFDAVADWISDFCSEFLIVEGIFDQWIGIPMEQALRKRGLSQLSSQHHTRQLSSQMFQNLKNLMFDNKLRIYNDPPPGEEYSEYITEVLELQANYVSKYIVEVEAPQSDGKHDDFADALVRMCWLATNNSSKRAIVRGVRKGFSGNPTSSSRFGNSGRRIRKGSHESRIPPKTKRRF